MSLRLGTYKNNAGATVTVIGLLPMDTSSHTVLGEIYEGYSDSDLLRRLGFNVPQYAIDDLRDDQERTQQ